MLHFEPLGNRPLEDGAGGSNGFCRGTAPTSIFSNSVLKFIDDCGLFLRCGFCNDCVAGFAG